MGNGIIVIVTKSNKKRRVIPEPQRFWANRLNDNQRVDFIAALDGLDKAAVRSSVQPKRAGEV